MSAGLRRWRRAAIGALLVAALGMWLASSATLGGFTTARIANAANKGGSGLLAVTHTYPTHAGSPTTATCTSAVAPPPTAVACPGTLLPVTAAGTQTDTITNNGTLAPARVTATTGLASCAPRQLSNTRGASDPLLPRNGTALNWKTGTSGKTAADSNPLAGAGSVTFTAASSDYASTSSPLAPPVANATLVTTGALGVWFKTSAANGGVLSFDSVPQVPTTATGNNTLALYLAGGNLGFRRSATASIGITTGKNYGDGAWHFVYVAISVANVTGVGMSTTIGVYVDGSSIPALLSTGAAGIAGPPVSAPTSGYWLLGWSQGEGFLSGTESDFVTFNTAAAGTSASLYNASSQSDFDTKAASAGAQLEWPLSDQGNSPYVGGYPIFGTVSDPCSMVTASWDGSTARTLTSVVATPINTSIPAVGATKGYALVLARATNFASGSLAGLQMYAPSVYTVSANGATTWTTTFTWAQSGNASTGNNPNLTPTFTL